ncbi:MAG: alanine racemase, partial [Myxococcota bacterium]
MRTSLVVALLAVFVALALSPFALAAEPGAVHPIERFTPAELEGWAAKFDTPLYLYDGDRIVANYRRIDAAFRAVYPKTRIHYALKANSNPAVIALLRAAGAGAEIVSEGELELALALGFRGAEILFTSNSKRPSEIDRALDAGAILNVDSEDELEQVAARSKAKATTARISFRLNPAVDPHTHAKIATGVVDSKFGLHFADGTALRAVTRALALAPAVRLVGLHSHIGSQITEPAPFRLAAEEMVEFVVRLYRDLGVRLEFVDLGGGLGIPYRDGQEVMSAVDWAQAQAEPLRAAQEALGGELPELWIEPG